MTERWHLGTWLGERFHTEEHIVTRKGDGPVIRSRAAMPMPEETTLNDLDSMKGSPWAPSGVLRDVLLDVPRPILSRDEPPFLPVEERPVPRNMKIAQDIPKKFGYTPGCAKCWIFFRAMNVHIQAWHTRRIVEPGSRQQAGRQTLCIVIEPSEQNSERWISTQRKWNGLIMKRRASFEPSVVPEPPTGERKNFHGVTQKVKII